MYAVRVASMRCTPEPSDHSDRIVSMRLPLKNKHYATLFSVYAPTLQAEPAEKEKFYSELRILPQGIPADDKLFVLGDFNARVGQDAVTWKKNTWQTRRWKLQRQQALTAGVLHGATTCHHQHHLSTKGQSGDNLDAPSV